MQRALFSNNSRSIYLQSLEKGYFHGWYLVRLHVPNVFAVYEPNEKWRVALGEMNRMWRIAEDVDGPPVAVTSLPGPTVFINIYYWYTIRGAQSPFTIKPFVSISNETVFQYPTMNLHPITRGGIPSEGEGGGGGGWKKFEKSVPPVFRTIRYHVERMSDLLVSHLRDKRSSTWVSSIIFLFPSFSFRRRARVHEHWVGGADGVRSEDRNLGS